MNLVEQFDSLKRPRVLVLGDLMLDRYTWGRANRISQEAPVLVLESNNQEHRLGGSSNVCHMLATLDVEVTCAGVVGDDEIARTLVHLLRQSRINCDLVLTDTDRPTTLKERFMGQSGSGLPSQILRVDTESRAAIGPDVEQKLLQAIHSIITQQDAILISDYAKGVCTWRCVRETIRIARQAGIPVLVDPGRDRDFRIYSGATLLKPNRVETENATGCHIETPTDALKSGLELCHDLDLDIAVITLDADGIALIGKDGTGDLFPAQARSVYDITGAGDMVLSILGLCLGSGVSPSVAVQIANVAAGLEVDRTGVATLTRGEIRREIRGGDRFADRKLLLGDQVGKIADEYRRRGKSIVFTNGCFDLLHIGHATYLQEAAAMGDILIVAMNSDQSVRRLKGPQRPIIGQNDRALMLSSLACVDHVVIFSDETPHQLLKEIRPDVLVKGGTYTEDQVVGQEIVRQYGGRVCVTDVIEGISTTGIVDSVNSRHELRRAG